MALICLEISEKRHFTDRRTMDGHTICISSADRQSEPYANLDCLNSRYDAH